MTRKNTRKRRNTGMKRAAGGAEAWKARDGRSSKSEKRRRPSQSPSWERWREERRSRERGRGQKSEERARQMGGTAVETGEAVSSSASNSSADSDQGGETSQGQSSVKEDRKKQKEMMKALETPEEKRARCLAKKECWSEEYMGYTNAENPFGDNNLLGTFKWQKVREIDWKSRSHIYRAIIMLDSSKGLFTQDAFLHSVCCNL
ncbi:cactin-like [Myxocyprinus asiaticus]|uniref:cactin-like n=1 Tax=Myxocyprinus asiaticus TaxID=70543 RepID=UPI0022223643|nr:cactin-like [Myxocyprinus asiaticus]